MSIYKCSWEVEPETTRNKFNEWSERVLNPVSPDLKASALTTGPHWATLPPWATLNTHVREHLTSNKNSHIFQHIYGSETCRDLCSENCFSILDTASTPVQLKIKEALLIGWDMERKGIQWMCDFRCLAIYIKKKNNWKCD